MPRVRRRYRVAIDPLPARAVRSTPAASKADSSSTFSIDKRATPVDKILRLQRTLGNRTTRQLLTGADRMGSAPEAGVSNSALMVQSTCAECEKEMQMQPVATQKEERLSPRGMMEHGWGQASADVPAPPESAVDKNLTRRLRSQLHGGRPLDKTLRAKLEAAMDADLGHVRIHTDAPADALSRQMGAEAFTVGNGVFFRSGRYQPGSLTGIHLLAHEITHTYQGTNGVVASAQRCGNMRIAKDNNPLERQAERVADATVSRFNSQIPPRGIDVSTVAGKSALERRTQPTASDHSDPVIQRKPTVDRSARGWEVVFDPHAVLVPDVGPNQIGRFDSDRNSETFEVSPAQVVDKAFARLLVDMRWRRKTSSGGKTNPGLIAAICDEAAFLNNVVLLQICEALKAGKDLNEIINNLTPGQLCSIILDNSFGEILPSLLNEFPFIGGILSKLTRRAQFETCRAITNTGIGPLRQAVLRILNALSIPGFKPPPPKDTFDRGNARAMLDTRLAFNQAGDLVMFGAPPVANSHGVAAELVSPVEFSREEIPPNGHITLAPMIRSRITTQRPGGETVPETHTFQRFFALDLKQPAPIPFACDIQMGPFHIGSDRFMREDEAHTRLFNWFFSLSPGVRQAVNRGEIPVVVAGRASTTGQQSFNLKLSEKRAERVRQIIIDFAGSDAHPRVFAFGELLAPTPDNVESACERRADVRIEGEVAPDKLAGADACGGPPQTLAECEIAEVKSP